MGALGKKKNPNARWAAMLPGLRWLSAEALIGMSLIAVVVAGGYYGWRKWGLPATQLAAYRLTLDNIHVTPQPSWIRADVKAEAVRDGRLEDVAIFDLELSTRVYRAFQMHPWVAKVERVRKRPPAKVLVDLVYRRPVGWVEVQPGVMPDNATGIMPIDGTGVLLPPEDFRDTSATAANQYIRISVVGLTPYGVPGAPWGDPRVAAAAQIAAVLADHVAKLQLQRIVVAPAVANDPSPDRSLCEIVTRRGLKFPWGRLPGREIPGEPKPAQKLLQLQQFCQTAGGSGDGNAIEQERVSHSSLR
jgi:hypothetical protein